MKYCRSEVQGKAQALPQLRFEDQALTFFAGLVIFQKFFANSTSRGSYTAAWYYNATSVSSDIW